MLELAPLRSPFATIAARVARGERLSRDDGLFLAASPDFLAVAQLAAQAKHLAHGDRAYYAAPRLAAFGDASITFAGARRAAFHHQPPLPSVAECVQHSAAPESGAWQIVVGEDSGLPFAAYTTGIAALRERFPAAYIQGCTASDLWRFQAVYHLSMGTILESLRAAGLDALAGDDAPDADVSTAEHSAILRAAHRLGLASTATLRCGAQSTWAERVDHLLRLRALQDETGGCDRCVVLVDRAHRDSATALAELRAIALSRLLLDNIPHIIADAGELGPQVAQTALTCGADTLQFPRTDLHADAASIQTELQDQLRALGSAPAPLRRAISLLGGPR